jgi:hypothetical protein
LPYIDNSDYQYTYTTLYIFSLLLEYGARVQSDVHGPFLARLLFHALQLDPTSNQYFILEQMIRMVVPLDMGFCYSHLHKNDHPLFSLIARGQSVFAATSIRGTVTDETAIIKFTLLQMFLLFLLVVSMGIIKIKSKSAP